MRKVKPESVIQVVATLASQDEGNPTDGLSNVALELYYGGQLHRTLSPGKAGNKYSAPISFPIWAELGVYTVKWKFDFGGEVITKEEAILLEARTKATIDIGFDIEKEITDAKFIQANAGIFPLLVPTINNPKFSQPYSQYTVKSSFQHQSCSTCMHYLSSIESSTGSSPAQCQLVIENPLPLGYDGWCRLWRPSYELEGYILFKSVIDEPSIGEVQPEYIDTTIIEVSDVQRS